MSTTDDLVKQATALAQQGDDLYGLLETTETAAGPEIHRAWKRKNLLHHPDKAGDDFDPVLYGRLEAARAILADHAARAAYDAAIAAARARLRERNKLDAGRRRMIDDLEAREAAGRLAKMGVAVPAPRRKGDDHQSGRETAAQARMREMREMAAEDARRLRDERERHDREVEDRRAREEKDEVDRGRRREKELRRRERDLERQLGEKMGRWAAARAGTAGTSSSPDRRGTGDGTATAQNLPTSGPVAWEWTRKMLVAEQRIREARRARVGEGEVIGTAAGAAVVG